MTPELLLIQTLNGLQFGVLLFLMAAGLTLVFGIMSFVNLAHGSLYMVGAYLAALTYAHSGSFWLALLAAVAGLFVLALALGGVFAAPLAGLITKKIPHRPMMAVVGLLIVLVSGRTLWSAFH